jgi:hypothetical protein
MPILKNLIKKDYDLLNIKNTKERPYFFGLGMPGRFNCNFEFDYKDDKDTILQSIENEESKIFDHQLRHNSKQNDLNLKNSNFNKIELNFKISDG